MIETNVAGRGGNVRKINRTRFVIGDFEYMLSYDPPWVLISRREVGKRRYGYYSRVDVTNCWKYSEVLDRVEEKLGPVMEGKSDIQ